MVAIQIDSVKTAQEHFRVLQHAVAFGQVRINSDTAPMLTPIYNMLTDILEQLGKMRPVGPDGKHGNLHTADCGCEDKTVPNRGYYTNNIRRNPNDPTKLQIKEIVRGEWVDLHIDEESSNT